MSKESRRRQRQTGQVPASGRDFETDPQAPARPVRRHRSSAAQRHCPGRSARAVPSRGEGIDLPSATGRSPGGRGHRRARPARRRRVLGHASRPTPARRSGSRTRPRRRAEGASPQPGYVQPDMGNGHVAIGTKVTYTYCPPAAGSTTTRAGAGPIPSRVYGPNDTVIPQGWVHNLEHGAIVSSTAATAPSVRRPGGPPGLLRRYPAEPGLRLRAGRASDRAGDRALRRHGVARSPRSSGVACCRSRRSTRKPSSTSTRSSVSGRTPRSCARGRESAAPSASAAPPARPRRVPHPRRRRPLPRAAPPLRAARPPRPRPRADRRPMRLIAFYGTDAVRGGRIDGGRRSWSAAVRSTRPVASTTSSRMRVGWRSAEPEERVPLQGLAPAPILLARARSCASASTTASTPRKAVAPHRRDRSCSPSSRTRSSGTASPIVRPEGTHALDLEVELGVVIGRTRRRVTRGRRHGSRRRLRRRQRHQRPRLAGHARRRCARARRATASGCAPRARTRSCRWDPIFVTADELDPAGRPAPAQLADHARRHRAPDAGRHDGRHDLGRPGARRVHQLASITLEPGDVIATGTPSGVGVFRDPPVFLEPGDRVRCEIEGIGSVENPIVDWSDEESGA